MELYHVLNRGVDKRRIFMGHGDRVRFVHDMFEFNDERSANNTSRLLMNDIVSRSYERNPIVDIHGWCLMGNHYHLLLSERREGGISDFMRKVNVGYAKFFNEKYKRTGTLFQGRTKKVLVDSDAHFLHILHYIHLNPLDLLKGAGEWRELRVRNASAALAYLDTYRWSSYQDYIGTKNFPSLLSTDLFNAVFTDYRQAITSYLKDIQRSPLDPFLLE